MCENSKLSIFFRHLPLKLVACVVLRFLITFWSKQCVFMIKQS